MCISPAVMDARELQHFYNAADVFVTTPWYEPFGITPLEAMACGRPVIGADVGGIRYSVAHGETGLLVPSRDPAALAHAIATLKRDPALARRMGERASRAPTRCSRGRASRKRSRTSTRGCAARTRRPPRASPVGGASR